MIVHSGVNSLSLFLAPCRTKNDLRQATENGHYAPGGGLYGLTGKAQGSQRIFVRSFRP